MPRYSPTNVPTSENLNQTQRWLREEFERVRGSTEDTYTIGEFILNAHVLAGYGGIGLDAITPLSNIGATWQTLPFDVELIAEPRGLSYVLGSEAIRFELEGIWRVNAKVSLEFNDSNQGRRLQLRVFNVTTGTPPSVVFNFAVGRNTDGVNLNFNLLVPVQPDQVGDVYVLQVNSAADSFTGVQAIGSIWDANHVSEYKGDFFDRVQGQRSRG